MASRAVLESMSLSPMPYLTAWVRRSVFVVSWSVPIPSFVNFWKYCFTLFTSIRPAHWALVGFADAKYLAMSIVICFALVSERGLHETKSNSWWSLRAMAPLKTSACCYLMTSACWCKNIMGKVVKLLNIVQVLTTCSNSLHSKSSSTLDKMFVSFEKPVDGFTCCVGVNELNPYAIFEIVLLLYSKYYLYHILCSEVPLVFYSGLV